MHGEKCFVLSAKDLLYSRSAHYRPHLSAAFNCFIYRILHSIVHADQLSFLYLKAFKTILLA